MPEKIVGEEGTKQFKVSWDAEQLATGKFKITIKVRADTNEETKELMENGFDAILEVLKRRKFELTTGKDETKGNFNMKILDKSGFVGKPIFIGKELK